MRCTTSDLEIETIYNRIKDGDINLQPDFQRGEVWTEQKRKKLIDSILREWKIPPIHVINSESEIDEVLDGQQRLATIKDFIDNKITVDGNIDPYDEMIESFNGKLYRDLPSEVKRRFKKYIIIFVRLTEYEPEEPAELFNRLNQPTTLTSAEKRNAYIGEPRNQIKKLTKLLIKNGACKETIGFSNSRLAYDEIISKFCYTLELGSLKKKITSNDISNKYRDNYPFTTECIYTTEKVIKKFMDSIKVEKKYQIILNKATLFSWLIFVRFNMDISNEKLNSYITGFEFSRNYLKGKKSNTYELMVIEFNDLNDKYDFLEIMVNTFNQRASMGSTDASSIIIRDIILNIYRDMCSNSKTKLLNTVVELYEKKQSMNIVLDEVIKKYNWGDKI
jgi:hypothetical protein